MMDGWMDYRLAVWLFGCLSTCSSIFTYWLIYLPTLLYHTIQIPHAGCLFDGPGGCVFISFYVYVNICIYICIYNPLQSTTKEKISSFPCCVLCLLACSLVRLFACSLACLFVCSASKVRPFCRVWVEAVRMDGWMDEWMYTRTLWMVMAMRWWVVVCVCGERAI